MTLLDWLNHKWKKKSQMPEFDINWAIPETSGIARVHWTAAAIAPLVIRGMPKVVATPPFVQTKMNLQQINLI